MPCDIHEECLLRPARDPARLRRDAGTRCSNSAIVASSVESSRPVGRQMREWLRARADWEKLWLRVGVAAAALAALFGLVALR